MTDGELDELRLLGEELRAVFMAERNAIAKLDHEALTLLSDSKQRIAVRLVKLQHTITPSANAEAKTLFEAIRIEAQATAQLAATAMKAVNTILGIPEPTGYDRRANRTGTYGPAFRNLRAF